MSTKMKLTLKQKTDLSPKPKVYFVQGTRTLVIILVDVKFTSKDVENLPEIISMPFPFDVINKLRFFHSPWEFYQS